MGNVCLLCLTAFKLRKTNIKDTAEQMQQNNFFIVTKVNDI